MKRSELADQIDLKSLVGKLKKTPLDNWRKFDGQGSYRMNIHNREAYRLDLDNFSFVVAECYNKCIDFQPKPHLFVFHDIHPQKNEVNYTNDSSLIRQGHLISFNGRENKLISDLIYGLLSPLQSLSLKTYYEEKKTSETVKKEELDRPFRELSQFIGNCKD